MFNLLHILYQVLREERELNLAKSSFASDLQIYAELDSIAGTTSGRTFPREVFVEFLRQKGWVIEELSTVTDVEEPAQSPVESETSTEPPQLPPVGL